MTIVANNSITLSNVNDGTITHTAWSYSADGTDRFTTVYPNLNLLEGSNSNDKSWVLGGNGAYTGQYVPFNSGYKYTFTYTRASTDWAVYMFSGLKKDKFKPDTDYVLSFMANVSTDINPGVLFANASAQHNFVNKLNNPTILSSKGDQKVVIQLRTSSSIPSESDQQLYISGFANKVGTFSIWDLKIEPGSTATPHMPSSSEVKTADWPRYIGQYTDDKKADSANPTDYTWSLIRGNDGKDGTDAPTITVKSYTFSAGLRAEIELTGPNAFKKTVYNRGHNVWVIDATTHKFKEFVSCDTYTTMSFSHNGVSTTLADYLASLKDSIIVIAASDADSVDQNVRDVLNRMGGFPDLGTWGSRRYGHVFIGMSKRNDGTWPLQPRQGYEEAINEDGSAPEIGCTLSKGGIVAKGADGRAGKDGKGIKATAITYQASTNGTTAPTGTWSASVPTVAKGSFLWTRTIWTYTDNTTETGYAVAYMGTNGNNGTNGIAGKDGTGIKKTTITYAGSTSGTTAPTNGWNSQVPNVPAGHYLWTKTVWDYTDKTSETGYSVARMGLKGDKGDPGIKGSDGTSGIIVSSVAPDRPQNGQLWQDTSTTPQLVKKWTGASWVIWELYVENMNVNNLSALSPNLGNITGGSYTSWKYIGMYNAQGDTAMAGIYINEGVIRSLVVINSNTQDPNKPNAIEFARLEGSQTAFGSTNYYIDNTPIYKQFTLNEVLKGSQFWNTTKRADINTLAGSIVVGKDADSASSIFISAQNAYISRWSTDYSFVDVDMLETISSHKVLFDGGFDNRYDATNNRDTNTLSLGNLVGVKYLQIYVCVYQRLHIINLDISNTFSAFDGIWRYSTLYNAPERATLSPGTWRDWNMELLCNGAIADSQLRWGGMFFKETGGMGYRAADTSNMKNTFIYKIVGVY